MSRGRTCCFSPAPRSSTACAVRCATRRSGEPARAECSHRLEQRNLLVIPMDRDGEWFRFHHLFRELLHAELLRTRTGDGPRASSARRVVVRGEWSAGGGDHPCAARRGRGARRSGRADAREPSLGERPSRHGAPLDAVVLGQRADRRATGCRRARRVDPRPRRQRRRGGALGRGRATHHAHGNPLGREHDGRHGRLPADTDLPGRLGGDAQRRGVGARRPQPDKSLSTRDAARGGRLAPPRRSTRILADGFFVRAVEEARSTGATRSFRCSLPSAASPRSSRDDWTSAEALASQALEIMQPELDDYWTSALPYAWAARVQRASERPELGA